MIQMILILVIEVLNVCDTKGLISKYEAMTLFKNNAISSIILDNGKYEYVSAYWRISDSDKILDLEDMKERIEQMTSFVYNKEKSCLHCC